MAKLRVAWRGVQILHVALTSSVVIYGGIGFAVTQQPGKPAGIDPHVLVTAFAIAAAVMLGIVVPVVRRVMLPERDRVGDGRTLELDAEIDPVIQGILAKLRPAFVMTWALCESVAVFGLALTFLYRDLRYYLPFGGVSFAALLVFAPRLSLLEECVRCARSR